MTLLVSCQVMISSRSTHTVELPQKLYLWWAKKIGGVKWYLKRGRGRLKLHTLRSNLLYVATSRRLNQPFESNLFKEVLKVSLRQKVIRKKSFVSPYRFYETFIFSDEDMLTSVKCNVDNALMAYVVFNQQLTL